MITLKNIKHSKFASHETHCYEADLYLDGKRVGQVGNQGHGGCDDVHFVSPLARKNVDDYIEALNYTFLDDAAMAAEIRRRICKLVAFGDDCYCKNDTQHSDEKLCAEYSTVLDIKWLQRDLAGICCRLVNDHLGRKELKRLLSKRVLYTQNGADGLYQTNCASSAKHRDHWIEQLTADENTKQILNTMPFDDALALFQGVA